MHPRTRIGAACAVLAAVILSAGCGAGAGAAPSPTVDRFDAARAFSDLRMQVDLGPRPAGSAASRTLAERLRRALPHGRFSPVPGGLRNVVGSLPGRGRPILVGAHYDTKDIPGFVGANDGATFLRRGTRGSRADAAVTARRTHSMVLVDFVADRDLSIPREAGSDPALWARLRDAADEVGAARVFPPRAAPAVLDDHVPYRTRGVPAIDLVDFQYPYWHTREDTLDKVSPRSLDAVGETLVAMLRSMARETCAGAAPTR